MASMKRGLKDENSLVLLVYPVLVGLNEKRIESSAAYRKKKIGDEKPQ